MLRGSSAMLVAVLVAAAAAGRPLADWTAEAQGASLSDWVRAGASSWNPAPSIWSSYGEREEKRKTR